MNQRLRSLLRTACLTTLGFAFLSTIAVAAKSANSGTTATSSPKVEQTSSAPDLKMANRLMSHSLEFVENKGQVVDDKGVVRNDIKFTASSNGTKLYIAPERISYVFLQTDAKAFRPGIVPNKKDLDSKVNYYRADMEFVGANTQSNIVPSGQFDGVTNFYTANSGADGISNVRSFGKLTYENVYPNIDMILSSKGSGAKAEFIVRPGGDPSQIKMKFTGADKVQLLPSGGYSVTTKLGTMNEQAPYSFIRVNGGESEVAVSFNVDNDVVSFNVPSYDKTQTLVIDPNRDWGTLHGGSVEDQATAVSAQRSFAPIGGSTYFYVCGFTTGGTFPTVSASQGTFGGGVNDAFIAAYTYAGARVYSTFWGGTGDDRAYGITADASGNAYVVGQTTSPVFTGINNTNTPAGDVEGFIATFTSAGARIASRYVGGTLDDYLLGVTLDNSGNITVAGYTGSSGIGTAGTYQQNYAGGGYSGMISRITGGTAVSGSAWLSYYGTTNLTQCTSISFANTAGEFWVGGYTTCPNTGQVIATTGSWSTAINNNGSGTQTLNGNPDGFVVRMTSSGGRTAASYYGSVNLDYIYGVSNDAVNDRVIVAGQTNSSNTSFIMASNGAFSTVLNNPSNSTAINDGFVAALSVSGTTLLRSWGTYWGSTADDYLLGVNVDDNNVTGTGSNTVAGTGVKIMVSGTTAGAVGVFNGTYNFNLAAPYQANAGGYDAIYSRLGSAGTTVELTGLFGGTGNDASLGIATDNQRNSTVVGFSGGDATPNIATSGAQTTNSAVAFNDGFVLKMCDLVVPNMPSINGTNPPGTGAFATSQNVCVSLNSTAIAKPASITNSTGTCGTSVVGVATARVTNAVQGVTYTLVRDVDGTFGGGDATYTSITGTASADGNFDISISAATLSAAPFVSSAGGTANNLYWVASTPNGCRDSLNTGTMSVITLFNQPLNNAIVHTNAGGTAGVTFSNNAAAAPNGGSVTGTTTINFVACGTNNFFVAPVSNIVGNTYSFCVYRLTNSTSSPTTLSTTGSTFVGNGTGAQVATILTGDNTLNGDTIRVRMRETNANSCSNEYIATFYIAPLDTVRLDQPAVGNNPNSMCSSPGGISATFAATPTGTPYAGVGTFAYASQPAYTYQWSTVAPNALPANGVTGAFATATAESSTLTLTGTPTVTTFNTTVRLAETVTAAGYSCVRNYDKTLGINAVPAITAPAVVSACENTATNLTFTVAPSMSGSWTATITPSANLTGATATLSGTFTSTTTFTVPITNTGAITSPNTYDNQGTIGVSVTVTNTAIGASCVNTLNAGTLVNVTQTPDAITVLPEAPSNTVAAPGGTPASTQTPPTTVQNGLAYTACVYDPTLGYGQTYTYTVTTPTPNAGANANDNYTWNIPGTAGVNFNLISGGATQLGSANPFATIRWLTTGSRTVTVTQVNNQAPGTCQTVTSFSVNVNPIPTSAGTLNWAQTASTADDNVCETASFTFAITGGPANGTVQVYNQVISAAVTGAGSPAGGTGFTAVQSQTLNGSGNSTAFSFTTPTLNGTTAPYSANMTLDLVVTDANGCGRLGAAPGIMRSANLRVWDTPVDVQLTTDAPVLGNNPATVCPNKISGNNSLVPPAIPFANGAYTYTVSNTSDYPANTTFAWALVNIAGVPYSTSDDYAITLSSSGGLNSNTASVRLGKNLGGGLVYWRVIPTFPSSSGGCTSTPVSPFNKTVTVSPAPVPNIVGNAAAVPASDLANANLSFNASPGLCSDNTAQYDAGAGFASYAWTLTNNNSNAVFVGGINSQTVTVSYPAFTSPALLTSVINARVTNPVTGCVDADTQTVFIRPVPVPTVSQAIPAAGSGPCVFNNENSHIVAYTVPKNPADYTIASVVWTIPTGTGAIYSYTTSSAGVLPGANDTVRIQWLGTGAASVRAVVTTTTGCSTTNTLSTFVYPVPNPVISGAASICKNTVTTYNVNPNVAGDSYTWDIAPSGGGVFTTASSGIGVVSTTINWNGNPNTVYTLRATQVSAQGCTARTTYLVTLNPNPAPVISGPTGVCSNQTASYSTQNNAPGASYVWTLTPGGGAGTAASIASGQSTASVTINTGSQASYSLTVQETINATSCTATTAAYAVTVATAPTATITRNLSGVVGAACTGTSYTYTANPTPGSGITYQWILNGTPLSGQTNQTWTNTWNAIGTNTVSVVVTLSATQCSTQVNQTVVVSNPPAPAISGPQTACGGGESPQLTFTYSTPLTATNNYTWTFPLGGATPFAPTSGTGVNTVTVNWSGTALNRSVRVVETDPNTGCATTSADYSVAVTTRPNPTLPTPGAACQNGAAQSYTFTTLVSGSTRTYTVTGGNFSVSSNNANDATISVNWTAAGTGVVQVTENNAGCTYSKSFNVTVNAAPTAYTVNTTTPNVCALGGSGNVTAAVITLSNSQTGVNYQLIQNGSPLGTITTADGSLVKAGNGAGLTWTITPAPNVPGTFNYAILAQNTSTTCQAQMTGSASVTVNALPNSTITGSIAVCSGTSQVYSVPAAGSQTYNWNVPAGWTITSGAGTNSITVTTGTSSGSVNVNVTNTSTGCSLAGTLSVVVTSAPTVFNVSPTVGAICLNQGTSIGLSGSNSGVTYTVLKGSQTVTTESGTGSALTIAIPSSAVATVGTHVFSITALATASPCNTTVIPMNGTLTVTVNPLPTPTISGPSTACIGQAVTFTTPSTGNNFAWSIITGAGTVAPPSNTNSVSMTFTGAAGSRTVQVIETNPNTLCTQTTTYTLNANATPTPTVAPGPAHTVCASSTVTYSTTNNVGNTYSWTVSGAGGNITGGQNTSSITVLWGSASGTGTVTVTETAGTCSNTSSTTVTVNALPTLFNVATTTPNVCVNGGTGNITQAVITLSSSQTGVNYQLVQNGTPLGTITTADGSLVKAGTGAGLTWTITPSPNVPGTFNYTIIAQNTSTTCQSTMTNSASVTVNALPNATITGTATVCTGTSQVYSVPAAGAQTYTWNVPAGWTITGGQGTNTMTATAGGSGTNNVTVVVTSTATGCSQSGAFAVTVTAAPTVFNVSPTVGAICLGQSTTIGLSGSAVGVTYTVLKGSQTITTAAGTGSALTIGIPSSAVATVGNHVFTMTALANAAPCNASIINMNGSLTVTVNPLPIPTISGPSSACIGQAVTFSTPATANNFAWTISSGSGTVAPPTNTNSASITFTGAAGSRTVQVIETNPNTLCTQSATYTLTANATPAPSVTPGPTQSVCASSTVTYSTPNTVGNNYSWTVSGAGGAITGGQGSNAVSVLWGSVAGTGTVTVTETAGTCSNTSSSTVTVNALPIAYNVGTITPGVCVTGNATITLSNSQVGVTYTLIRNGTAQSPTVAGNGGQIQFVNSLTTAGTYGYTISATSTSPVCTNLMNGTATVIANNPPTPTITGATAVCANSSSTYTVTPANAGSTYAYQVSGAGNALGAQSGNQITVNWGTNSGTLSVIETNISGCTGNTSFAVTVNPLPTAQTVTLTPTTICAGGGLGSNSTTATAGLANSENGYTYQLLSAANNVLRTATGTGGAITFSPSFSNLSAGSITWTVRAISNSTPACTTAAMSNSVTLTIVPNPAPAVNGPTTPCQNGTVTYQTTNNTGATYAWNIVSGTGSFSPSNTYQTSGTWTSIGAASIRVVETNSAGCSQENILSVDITTAPTPTITAVPSATTVCGQSTVTYSTAATGTSYSWSVGSGGTLTSGQGTNSITVVWANPTPDVAASSNVNLTVMNGTCAGSTSRAVTINPQANPVVTGDAARCSGQTGNYSTPFVVSGRSYTWSISNLPPGMTFSPVTGTNLTALSVNWVNTGTTPVVATVQVVETPGPVGNTCTGTSTFNVTVNPLPVVTISGPTQVCQNTSVSYTATPTQTGLNYAWNVIGANFTGQGTATINVTFGTTNATIQLIVTNIGTGCTNTASNNNYAVLVTPTPTPNIATPPGTTACAGSTVTYNVLNPSASFTYSWANTGATSASTPSGNSYTVSWPSTPGNGTITLTATTLGGTPCSGSEVREITIAPNPAPSITGETAVCPNVNVTYATPFVANDIYQWTLPAGTFQVMGGSLTGNSVTVRWNSPGTTAQTRNVTVTETSQFGCVGTATVVVTVNPAPTPIIAGNTNTCGYLSAYDGVSINNVETYTVTNPVNALSTFLWTIPNGGGTFTSASSGVNVTSVTVQWNEPTTSASTTRVLRVQETTNATPNCTGQTDINVQTNWNPKPAITGNRTVCSNYQYAANSTDAQMYTPYTYSTAGLNQTINPPASSYVWDVRDINNVSILTSNPATTIPGARITGSGNQVQVEYFNPTNAPITMVLRVTETISYTNALQTPSVKSCPIVDTFVVVVNPLPKPVIAPAPTDVCGRSTATYATTGNAGSTFLWTVGTGTIVGANNTNNVTITWNDVAADNTAGFVQVSQTFNATSCSTTVRQNVNVDVTPTPVISGPTVLCQGTTNGTNQGTYQIVSVLPNRAYLWSIDAPTSGPVTITAGPNNLNVFQITVNGNTNVPVNAVIRVRETSTATTNNGATGGAGCFAETTYNVTLNPNPTPVITSSTGGLNVFGVCAGSSHTYATASNVGNTYSWSVVGGSIVGSSTNNSVSILWGAAGAGSVSVRERVGTIGCYTDVTTPITIRPLPNPDLTNQTGGQNSPSVCALSTTVYSTPNVAGDSYVWSVNGGTIASGQGTNSISVTWGAAGNGSVTITETTPVTLGSCSATRTLAVTINPLPTPSIQGPPQPPVCINSTQTYSTALSAGRTYLWSNVVGGVIVGANNTNTVNVNWTAAGNGSLTVTETITATNCSASATRTIPVNALPIVTITPSGTLALCSGQTVTLAATDGFVSYTWNTGETTPRITVRQAGPYSVTVVDGNGCQNTSSTIQVTVANFPAPVVTLNGPASFCEGDVRTLTATVTGGTPLAYKWSTGATSASINVTTSGTYNVEVTYSNTCKIKSQDVVITVSPKPVVAVTASGPTKFCDGGNVILDAGAGYVGYQWLNGATPVGTSRTLQVRTGGNYSVKVTNAGGCDATSTPTAVTVNPNPVPNITNTGDLSFCLGDSVVLSAPAGFKSYTWSPGGATTQNIVVKLTGGRYTVTVTDTNNCVGQSGEKVVTVFQTPQKPGLTLTVNTLSVDTTGKGYTSFQWKKEGTDIAGATKSSHDAFPTGTGSYTLVIKDRNGCSSTSDPIRVITLVDVKDQPIGFAQNVSLYPNPTNGNVTLKVALDQSASVATLSIRNLIGSEVMNMNLNEMVAGENVRQIDMSLLPSGIYYVEVLMPNGNRLTARITKVD